MSVNAAVTEPPIGAFVELAEALTWIAFHEAMDAEALRKALIGRPVIDRRNNDQRLRDFYSPSTPQRAPYASQGRGLFRKRGHGLEKLEQALVVLWDQVDRGTCEIRARPTNKYSPADAELNEPELMSGSRLALFSQFDIATNGIRRRPIGQPRILWEGHAASWDRGWQFGSGEPRVSDGYFRVEVRRDLLLKAFPVRTPGTAPNSQLDPNEIIARATAMLARQPSLSKGAAAASIVAELPPNPKSGKPRDSRHIERMITPLWEGGLSEFLP